MTPQKTPVAPHEALVAPQNTRKVGNLLHSCNGSMLGRLFNSETFILALHVNVNVQLPLRDQVFIPPGEIHLDRLEPEDVFTFNVEFDSDGNPDLNKDAISPCHNISAYTNTFLKIFQVGLGLQNRPTFLFCFHSKFVRSLTVVV